MPNFHLFQEVKLNTCLLLISFFWWMPQSQVWGLIWKWPFCITRALVLHPYYMTVWWIGTSLPNKSYMCATGIPGQGTNAPVCCSIGGTTMPATACFTNSECPKAFRHAQFSRPSEGLRFLAKNRKWLFKASWRQERQHATSPPQESLLWPSGDPKSSFLVSSPALRTPKGGSRCRGWHFQEAGRTPEVSPWAAQARNATKVYNMLLAMMSQLRPTSPFWSR